MKIYIVIIIIILILLTSLCLFLITLYFSQKESDFIIVKLQKQSELNYVKLQKEKEYEKKLDQKIINNANKEKEIKEIKKEEKEINQKIINNANKEKEIKEIKKEEKEEKEINQKLDQKNINNIDKKEKEIKKQEKEIKEKEVLLKNNTIYDESDIELQETVNGYLKKDFVVTSSNRIDLAGQPITGDINFCIDYCNYYKNCAGFTRQKKLPNKALGLCWLKKGFPDPVYNNWKYQTFVKP
jgi:hypothetical protein